MTYLTKEIAECETALREVGARIPEAVIPSMIPMEYHGDDNMKIRTADGRVIFIDGIDRKYASQIVHLFHTGNLKFNSKSIDTIAA